MRKLKYHEQKLLKKVNFFDWELDNNVHESSIINRYRLKNHEEYTVYNSLSREIRQVAQKIKDLSPTDPFRTESSRMLIEKLYSLGLIPTKRGLDLCGKVTASSFCRRRLPVVLCRNHMAETLSAATEYVQHGHVRVGPEMINDPAYLVPRNMEDFVTWTNSSKIRTHVLEYNDERDDFDLLFESTASIGDTIRCFTCGAGKTISFRVLIMKKSSKHSSNECEQIYSDGAVRNNYAVLEYSRTCQAAASGVAAGILGLTGLNGFMFYCLCAFVQSAVWCWKAGFHLSDYFTHPSAVLTHGVLGGLFTYVLFWTFLYGIVHVY
ncbi:Rab5ip and Ribosomal S4 and S4 domain containing protein [Trichuris trichiura]|uniref:ER membrane protein complex subunit 6 n=1 Tax=Trichuris trichiura TaxID=36087 RepID=A0A077Z7G0_TRITR|nr:Rab5ip and Ribosomal S4 and S4 domain containing protein [Trichuris trichiura]